MAGEKWELRAKGEQQEVVGVAVRISAKYEALVDFMFIYIY